MKYNLKFDKFAKLILESLIGEMEVDEAYICKNSSNWTLIDDRNIGSYVQRYPKIGAIMEYLKNKYPNNILSFKLSPDIDPDQKVYELYINVNTTSQPVGNTFYPNDKQGRSAFYEIMRNDFNWNNLAQLESIPINVDNVNIDYKVGSAEERLSSKFQNPKKIRLTDFKVDKVNLQNSIVPLGLFTEVKTNSSNKKQIELDLDTLVKFRIEELKSNSSANKKQLLETHVKNAASLISSIFNGEQVIRQDKQSRENFSKSLINNLRGMNVPDDEFNTYNELFGEPFFDNLSKYKNSGFDPTTLTENTKEFLLKTNALIVISEIIIPWVLINGIKKFSGVNLIEALLGKESNDTVIAVSWPTSATNQNTDYNVSFAKFNSGKEVGISAKSEGGHLTSAMSAIINASKTDKDKFIALDNLLGKCARTVYNVQQAWSNSTAVFYCWCIASVVNFNKEMVSSDFEDLRKLHKLLTTSEKRIFPKTFSSDRLDELNGKSCEKIVQKYFGNLTFKTVKENYPRDAAAWPYSLTNVCERIVVKALNDDGTDANSSRSTFYNIKMGGKIAYHQIELYRNVGSIITLICKPPKQVGSDVNNTSSVIFKVATGSGNKLINNKTDVSVCNGIAKSSGSHGAVIAVQLNN